jgi:hypothetical protein
MKLSVQQYLVKHGLEKTIEDFALECRDYGHKILLKYNQIDSNFNHEEVCDCRGLVLEKGTWKIMSMSFRKFFNLGETKAAPINLAEASIYEKLDGSMIHVYWDWVIEKWCIGTTGTAEAEGPINTLPDKTFRDLFLMALSDKEMFFSYLIPGNTYVFELCTPYNIVVTPWTKLNVSLLAVRNLQESIEYSYKSLSDIARFLNVDLVKKFDFQNVTEEILRNTFELMPFSEEGYIAVDYIFNRVKIKNPKYVAVHFMKSETAYYRVLAIVKSGEIDEFIATFPDRKEEIEQLKNGYLSLLNVLNSIWEKLKDLPLTNKEEIKHFALTNISWCEYSSISPFKSIMFTLSKDTEKVHTIKSLLDNFDEKDLYNFIKNNYELYNT